MPGLGSCSLFFFLISTLLREALGQNFQVLSFRHPKQCERMQCIGSDRSECKDHLQGFYAKEKGCTDGQICSNCTYEREAEVKNSAGYWEKTTLPTICRCENPPYFQYVRYGDRCDAAKLCEEGECFRPCYTYLHVTQCPKERCLWNKTSLVCEDAPDALDTVPWQQIRHGKHVHQQAFPMNFEDFEKGAKGYHVMSFRLDDLILLETLFIQIDGNNDGSLSQSEFEKLPAMLDALDQQALEKMNETDASNRRLQEPDVSDVNPDVCNEQDKVFCSFDRTCKENCSSCGWKSAMDRTYYMCVQPTPQSCNADGSKEYCPADRSCHPTGDCSKCAEMPIVDHRQHVCMVPWWDKDPPQQWSNWVCRHRKKVGMSCRNDMDCIYGTRRCLEDPVDGAMRCQPLQAYNRNHTCEEDYDCPHIGYYCPEDPTLNPEDPSLEDPYFVKYCRRQKDIGEKCEADRECSAKARCNTVEKPPRCRALFSLEIGYPAVDPALCILGWTDKFDRCATPAKSKAVGQSCESDFDCVTTDQTGKLGECRCKQWWDSGDSKYCVPVAGDYTAHQENLRNWLYFKAHNCGSFWSDEACVQEYGADGLRYYYALKCEEQTLSKGPYLPPAECNIKDEERFVDYCSLLLQDGAVRRGFKRPDTLLLLLMAVLGGVRYFRAA